MPTVGAGKRRSCLVTSTVTVEFNVPWIFFFKLLLEYRWIQVSERGMSLFIVGETLGQWTCSVHDYYPNDKYSLIDKKMICISIKIQVAKHTPCLSQEPWLFSRRSRWPTWWPALCIARRPSRWSVSGGLSMGESSSLTAASRKRKEGRMGAATERQRWKQRQFCLFKQIVPKKTQVEG